MPGGHFWWHSLWEDVWEFVSTCSISAPDRFSKMAYFRALPKLTSNKETEEAVLLHVFHLHGLTQDIVLDLIFEGNSAGCWEHQWVSLRVSIPSQTLIIRQRGTTKACGQDSSVSPLGPTLVWYDISQLTPYGIHILHCFSASMGTNRHMSQSWRGKSMFRWPSQWIIVAMLPGGSREQPFFKQGRIPKVCQSSSLPSSS